MAFEAPRHAVRFGVINHRHVIDRAVATETADAAVHVRCVIVINVIDRAMDPYPLDRVARSPACPNWLKLWVILLHLRMAVHTGLGVRDVRLRCHFYKAVTIPTIHS